MGGNGPQPLTLPATKPKGGGTIEYLFPIHIVHIFWRRLECILQDFAEFLEAVFDQGGVAYKSLLVVQIHFRFGRICRIIIKKVS